MVDKNSILDRVKCPKLQDKIMTAEQAAEFIKDGMNVATSGFTPSGYPKAVPLAIAEKAKKSPMKINLWTGASVGPELDGALNEVGAINRRLPYQTNDGLRKSINSGKVKYTDLHLSHVAQMSRYGFFGGGVDVAIVEACEVNEDGSFIPTTSMGNTSSFVQSAKQVIIEVNVSQPVTLRGMHDSYVPLDPPHRKAIPIETSGDRIGTEYVVCDPAKIVAIVPCDITDKVRDLAPIDDDARAMGENLVAFFKKEVAEGRLPENLLPLQSGVGSVANAVVNGLVNSDFKDLTVYTEVVQDGMFDLIDAGKLKVCSGTALSPSPAKLKKFYENLDFYKPYLILRPQEVANSPEIARRIGVIAMNTAIEVDIYGNVNSTHVVGTKMMNGIGGSGDYARNGYLTVFFTNSVAKGGDISSVVPFCAHLDHTEHDVDLIVSERGVADLRGKCPVERAREIIANVAHPDYQPLLTDYLERAIVATKNAHTPHILSEAFSFHTRFNETGSMKKK